MSRTMGAVALSGPGRCAVEEVPVPVAVPGEVVVGVERVGICGTDVGLLTGELSHLRTGHSSYPRRPGHEWCGRVTAVGEVVDPAWLGRRVTGTRCSATASAAGADEDGSTCVGDRQAVGIRGGRPGALAERLAVPVQAPRIDVNA